MFDGAILIHASHHMTTFFWLSWSPTTTAKSLLPMPMDHRTGIKKKSPIRWRQRSVKFTQLKETRLATVKIKDSQGILLVLP
jgi:hypothetical protein